LRSIFTASAAADAAKRPHHSRPLAAKAARKAQAVFIATPRRPILDKISVAAQRIKTNSISKQTT